MSKLVIKCDFNKNLKRVFVIGSFCDWDVEKAIEVKKIKNARLQCDVPNGSEFKILCSRDWLGQDKLHADKNIIKENNEQIIVVKF